MRRVALGLGSHPALRLAAAGCLAASLAGCADSERLSDPFSNPFHTASANSDQAPTGTVGTPYAPVQSAPLAPPNNSAMSGAPAAPMAYAPSHSNPQFAATNSGRSSGSVAGWTAEGGMPIVVAQGETADIVAHRYGIPEVALLRTNGFASSTQIHPGTRLVIPIYNAALAASSGVHVGARQEAADHAPSHQERAKVAKAEAEHAKDVKAEAREKRDEKIAAAEAVPVPKVETSKSFGKPPEAQIEKVALTDTGAASEPKKPIDNMPIVESDHGKDGKAVAAPEFRWPARGRIIRSFTGNDGINIALPENTPVKAAEAGVVAYAGNEVKGYGNLILIRHPNGFVSAYANNAEIEVKRGDIVKRGQVIAKSGQTGNVSTPQLHFELRKGSKPVDPIQYLAGL
jgi:murein DD-endopeptidase MepM/ murein hydrolase activator NlpD